MIIKPIISVWLMIIISIAEIILIIQNKRLKEIVSNKPVVSLTDRQKNLIKKYRINSTIKILIVILLFIINLRPMISNGKKIEVKSDLSVLFVIDKSVSMRALDYNGNKERFEGVIDDCVYIVNELSGSKFSIITFGNTAEKIIPFTTDANIVEAELKAINLENDIYANGSSINLVKDVLEDTLKEESKRQNGNAKFVLFFITDGEITKEGETLASFSNISEYISNGAIMGYGTDVGGKMVNSIYSDNPYSENYYIYYYDDNHNRITALSKIDENNLKKIGTDIKIDYIKMTKQSNIDYKLEEIKQQMNYINEEETNKNIYQDIYYYLGIPLVIFLMADLIFKKRRM